MCGSVVLGASHDSSRLLAIWLPGIPFGQLARVLALDARGLGFMFPPQLGGKLHYDLLHHTIFLEIKRHWDILSVE